MKPILLVHHSANRDHSHPRGSLPALQACLAAALADPARLRQMGAESYRIARDEINIEQMVLAFIRALNSTRQIN